MSNMDAETRNALVASIEHWKDNERAEDPWKVFIRSDTCALCALFVNLTPMCAGCPVSSLTGVPCCGNTPWIDASRSLRDWRHWPDSEQFRDLFRERARAMREFLEAILKEET